MVIILFCNLFFNWRKIAFQYCVGFCLKGKLLSHVWLLATPWAIQSWNSPGQNTGVGSLSRIQGLFPTQGSNPGLLVCRRILYQLSHKQSPRILECVPIPSPADLPYPGIKMGSPALKVISLPTELWGKPLTLSISKWTTLCTLSSHDSNWPKLKSLSQNPLFLPLSILLKPLFGQ